MRSTDCPDGLFFVGRCAAMVDDPKENRGQIPPEPLKPSTAPLADSIPSGAETTPQREKSASDDSNGKDIGTIANRKTYGHGATRSGDTDNFAFDLIPSCASRREAKRWRQGERGHGRGNWQQGQPIAVQVRHLLAHCNAYLAALERGEALAESARDDHLAAIRCNAAMLMWYEEAHPELFEPGRWQAEVDE